ncbi:MAG: hypothetical protein ABI240_15215 [Sphingomonas sp.]
MRADFVSINFPAWSAAVPFGGYQPSGNGKQYGVWGSRNFSKPRRSSWDRNTARCPALPPSLLAADPILHCELTNKRIYHII